jgi:dihydrofolate reductase
MPELLIDFITSLDGYAAADGWPGWWGLEGPEYLAWLGESPEADYTVLMGANTYRLMSGFAAAGEPGTDALAGLSKVVFSTTLREAEWANTQLVAQDPVESVRAMKDEGARPMRTIGSLTSPCAAPFSKRVSSTASAWLSFPSSPEAAVESGSTTATPMLLWT